MRYIANKSYVFLLLMAMASQASLSQSYPLYKHPAFTFAQSLSWWDSIYRFPDFEEARFTYFTGFTPDQTIMANYNLYYGQMDIINSNGDTLQLTPIRTLRFVQMGENLFYFDPRRGYLEVLVRGPVSLGSHTLLLLDKMDHLGGNPDTRGVPTSYDRYYRIASSFYFINDSQRVYMTSKASILKLFPEFKRVIKDFIRKESIDFKRKQDLVKLSRYCNELRSIPDASN